MAHSRECVALLVISFHTTPPRIAEMQTASRVGSPSLVRVGAFKPALTHRPAQRLVVKALVQKVRGPCPR